MEFETPGSRNIHIKLEHYALTESKMKHSYRGAIENMGKMLILKPYPSERYDKFFPGGFSALIFVTLLTIPT